MDTKQNTEPLPDTDDLDAMRDLIKMLGYKKAIITPGIFPVGCYSTESLVEVRGTDATLRVYWDDLDPEDVGWAWCREDADDMCSGSLDSVGELRDLLGRIGRPAHTK